VGPHRMPMQDTEPGPEQLHTKSRHAANKLITKAFQCSAQLPGVGAKQSLSQFPALVRDGFSSGLQRRGELSHMEINSHIQTGP
jgi:hypothetical protein